MKSFSIVIRIHQLPDGYFAENVRNITYNAMENVPWPRHDMAVYVEEVRPMPDLDADTILSDTDIAYLQDLREVIVAQRSAFTDTVRRITMRLERHFEGGGGGHDER